MNEINGKGYWRVVLGRGHKYAGKCFAGNYIGAGWLKEDLTGEFSKGLPDFKKVYAPKLNISKGAVDQACASLYKICKKMRKGDIVLCPDGKRNYRFAEIKDDYHYVRDTALPHRREVEWLGLVSRNNLPEALRGPLASQLTVIDLKKDHDQEIEKLISNISALTIEDQSAPVKEKDLEEILIKNWEGTELSKDWDLLTDEEGEIIAQQFSADTGRIDILAISKDEKEFLVVELKKNRASYSAVGQILSYMSYIREEIAEEGQEVKGCIIAFEDDPKIKRALKELKENSRIDFYLYKIKLDLKKV